MALEITDNNFKEILAEGKPVVIDFWAPWCGPCKMLGPIIEQLGDEMDGKAVIGKVDIDEEQALAERFGVMSIPTVVCLLDGVEKSRSVGLMPKDKLIAALGL